MTKYIPIVIFLCSLGVKMLIALSQLRGRKSMCLLILIINLIPSVSLGCDKFHAMFLIYFFCVTEQHERATQSSCLVLLLFWDLLSSDDLPVCQGTLSFLKNVLTSEMSNWFSAVHWCPLAIALVYREKILEAQKVFSKNL